MKQSPSDANSRQLVK